MENIVRFAQISPVSLLILSPVVCIAIVLSLVRVHTTWAYYQTLKQFAGQAAWRKQSVEPPQIPFTLPFFGNTFSFLNGNPGQFWNKLLSWHPRSTGICTLLLGGRRTHILFSPPAVQALFKARSAVRDVFENDLYAKVFALNPEQVHNLDKTKQSSVELESRYLSKHEPINELTAHFSRTLEEVLDKDVSEITAQEEIGLYKWLRDRMFTASITALMGEKLLQMYPDYSQDFFIFNTAFRSFVVGLPRFLMGDAIERRDRIIRNLIRWSKAVHDQSPGGKPVDPEGPAWEPLMGSRLNRARQLDYRNRRMDEQSSAAMDLGMAFALSSNVIPATCWMLMHILDPEGDRTVLPRVLNELQQAEKADGSLDIPILMSQPFLQSIWTETLRLDSDVIVARNLTQDLMLPLDEDGKKVVSLRKGDNVFTPGWLSQRDETGWAADKAPVDTWYAGRFLVTNAETGRQIFSMDGSAGKFLPFGGGRTICPGRVFAKQEGLSALAIVLRNFELEVKGCIDASKKPTAKIPKPERQFPGGAIFVPGGDMKVKVSKRKGPDNCVRP